MRQLYLIIIILGSLTACNNNRQTEANTGNLNSKNETKESIDNDSIRIVSAKIINGERIWGNNEKYLFSIMDSLTNKSSESRSFYFKAFGKICEQADGYVSEVIGQYVLKYFELDAREFLQNSKTLNDKSFKTMGYNAGLELAMGDYDPNTVIDALIKNTNEKLNDLNEPDKQRLDMFFAKIKEGFKSGME
jgi:hypothetical protein